MLNASCCGLPLLDAMHAIPPVFSLPSGPCVPHLGFMGDLVCAILGEIPGMSSLESSVIR